MIVHCLFEQFGTFVTDINVGNKIQTMKEQKERANHEN